MSVPRSSRSSTAAGYGSPRDYCGHGIGRAMHEDPDVENRGRRGKGPRLEPGVVLAIEPMLIAGGRDDVVVLDDDWTVVTADGSLAAHTEHTVVIPPVEPRRPFTGVRETFPHPPTMLWRVPGTWIRADRCRSPLIPTSALPG